MLHARGPRTPVGHAHPWATHTRGPRTPVGQAHPWATHTRVLTRPLSHTAQTLERQVRRKKRSEEMRVTTLLTEPAPDHSRVHPEEAVRDYLVEEQAKAALRAALDEQVEQRSKHRKRERRTQIRQDRFFIKGVNEAYVSVPTRCPPPGRTACMSVSDEWTLLRTCSMEKDREYRARKRQNLIDSLQYEWQRQTDLKKLLKATDKQLR